MWTIPLIEMWTFLFQICFGINFQLRKVVQLKITQIQKQIWNKNVHISIQKFVLKSFGQYEMDGPTKCHKNG